MESFTSLRAVMNDKNHSKDDSSDEDDEGFDAEREGENEDENDDIEDEKMGLIKKEFKPEKPSEPTGGLQ